MLQRNFGDRPSKLSHSSASAPYDDVTRQFRKLPGVALTIRYSDSNDAYFSAAKRPSGALGALILFITLCFLHFSALACLALRSSWTNAQNSSAWRSSIDDSQRLGVTHESCRRF